MKTAPRAILEGILFDPESVEELHALEKSASTFDEVREKRKCLECV